MLKCASRNLFKIQNGSKLFIHTMNKNLLLKHRITNVPKIRNRSKWHYPEWTSPTSLKDSVTVSDKMMIIRMTLKGFKKEAISVKVDGSWLIIEGDTSAVYKDKEMDGLTQRHFVKRYQIPPDSTAIKPIFDEIRNSLVVIVPIESQD